MAQMNGQTDEAASPPPSRAAGGTPPYVRKVLVVFGIGALFLAVGALLWHASQVLLLVFAGVLIAILLQDAGRQLRRLLPLSEKTSMVLVLLLAVATLVAS